MALSNSSAPAGLTADDIIARMLEHNRFRNEHLQRYRQSGRTRSETRREIGGAGRRTRGLPGAGQETFNKTSEEGSGIVRHLVFDRLYRARARHLPVGSIATVRSQPRTIRSRWPEKRISARIIALFSRPLRNAKRNICSREIWIDAEDFAIAKIAGHLLKNRPSGSIELTLSGNIKELMVFGFLAGTRRPLK